MCPFLWLNDFNQRIEADAGKDHEFVISIKENVVSSNASKAARKLYLDAKSDGYALPIANDLSFSAAGVASAQIPRCLALHELAKNS